jgi:peptidoglycan/LPS O-acetylase OafA/YrhL
MILIAREVTARTFGLNVTFSSVLFATTLALVLILSAGHFSYRFVELPIQRRMQKKEKQVNGRQAEHF